MAQKESRAERTEKSSSSNVIPNEFGAARKNRSGGLFNLQAELLSELQEINHRWFDRAQSEANLASEFASKLTAARSVPEAMAACQQWTSRRFEMLTEDGKYLLADTQKFMAMGARFMPHGRLPNGSGARTQSH